MLDRKFSEEDIRQLEAQQLQSEIARNRAECDELASRLRSRWKPSLLGLGVFLVMLATFGDFFSNLYQIALVDREALKAANEKLLKQNAILELQTRLAAQSLAATTTLRAITMPSGAIKEPTLYGAILVTRWGGDLEEALAVRLDPVTKSHSDDAMFAHGGQLGIDKPASDLGLVGGQEWSGKWVLQDDRIQISETYPRPLGGGITIEIDLTKRLANGCWPATRTRDGVVESGLGEILFQGTSK